jgi:RHS repeat-associated protein
MEYDNLERQTAEVLPDGTRLAYTLDDLGRLTAVDGYIDQIDYLRGKLVSGVALHNGVHESWQYDDLDRKTHRQVQGPDGSGWIDLSYTYSRGGLLQRIEDASDDHDGPGLGATFTYDALYRLTGAVLDPGRAQEETLAFQYDGAQNLVQKTSSLGAASRSHVGQLKYGEGAGPHAVTHAGDMALTYDHAGFVTQRGDVSLEWDYRGRLTDVSDGADMIAHYVYGTDEQRVISREGAHFTYHLSPTFEIEDGMALAYVTIANQRRVAIESAGLAAKVLSDVAPATDSGGTLTVDADDAITAGDAVVAARVATGQAHLAQDQALSPVDELLMSSARRTLLDGEKRVTYDHFDASGNLVAISDQTGKLVERRAYDPYGLQRTLDQGETTYGFSGKRTDRSTGLTFFGERYYDAAIGRWTAPDPMFRTLNVQDASSRPWESAGSYLFNVNNPIAFEDESGATTNENGSSDDNANSVAQQVSSQSQHSQENQAQGPLVSNLDANSHVHSDSFSFSKPEDNFFLNVVDLAVASNRLDKAITEQAQTLEHVKSSAKMLDDPDMTKFMDKDLLAGNKALASTNVAWQEQQLNDLKSAKSGLLTTLKEQKLSQSGKKWFAVRQIAKAAFQKLTRSRTKQLTKGAKAEKVLGGKPNEGHKIHTQATKVVSQMHMTGL